MKVIGIVANNGWFCNKCKKSMNVLFKTEDGKSFCPLCIPKEKVTAIKYINQNREVLKRK